MRRNKRASERTNERPAAATASLDNLEREQGWRNSINWNNYTSEPTLPFVQAL